MGAGDKAVRTLFGFLFFHSYREVAHRKEDAWKDRLTALSLLTS